MTSTFIDNIICKYFINENGTLSKKYSQYKFVSKKYPNIYNYLTTRFNDSTCIRETVYRIKYHFEVRPVCKYCGCEVSFLGNIHKLFSDHCSQRCSSLDKDVQQKTKQTYMNKYGVECSAQLETNVFKTNNPSKNEESVKKRRATSLKLYGGVFNIERCKETWIKKYGVDNPWKSNEIQNKCKETWIRKYEVDNPMKSEFIREKGKQTCFEKYGVEYYQQSKMFIDNIDWEKRNTKSINTKRINNSFNNSKPEDLCYTILLKKYPDTIRQYKSKEYPFLCDFYIPSINMYIEFQGSQYHHGHPFNENNIDDINELNKLKYLESEKLKTNRKTQYTKIIYTWTDLDIRKRNIAKQNKLNFIEIWNINDIYKI